MEIKSLILENFRRFKKKELEFSLKTNLLLGRNKSGKTTILEAIFLLSTASSFRAEKIAEVIAWERSWAKIQGFLSDKTKLEIIFTPGEFQGKKVPKKKLIVNDVEKKRRDFVGQLLSVLFRPEDIRIITGSPARRREFFDTILSQTTWEYSRSLSVYQKALRNRNKILERIREGTARKSDLYFWNQSLEKNGEVIFQARSDFVEFVNQFWPEGLRLFYQQNPFNSQKNLQKEIARGMTLSGPHRDDFSFEKNGRDLSAFGSRSEQRLVVLNLKLAELEYIKRKRKESPVFLLDDVFSELDRKTRAKVMAIIPQQQSLITVTELGLINEKFRDKMKIIELK